MAATRLSDSQKQELVARFRGGEASAALAEAFGCSANTVSRVVRTALDPKDYEALKQQRGRSAGQAATPAGESSPELPLAPAGSGAEAPGASALDQAQTAYPFALSDPEGSAASTPGGSLGSSEEAQDGPSLALKALIARAPQPDPPAAGPEFGAWVNQKVNGAGEANAPGLGARQPEPYPEEISNTILRKDKIQSQGQDDDPSDDQGHAALAIDDADDFAEEAGDDEGDDTEDGSEDGDSFVGRYGDSGQGDGQTFVILPLGQAIEDRPSLTVQPLEPADLPASVYMLVDKTVELDIKPLKELPELGTLPAGEEDRQALVVYANPRQAKRYCGRNQRVIKVPDSGVLARTAPYLLSQGVTRLVVEGALYSLPGS